MKLKISHEAADALVCDVIRDSMKMIISNAKKYPSSTEPKRDAKLLKAMQIVLDWFS